ncbi:hypothetical protein [Tautonia marina]|uniref:hypothetical protein n=1 Tax=Tautonia marina TaxID=2653855 RepID=UPI001260E593|nr:hypothetical protein [Tautonia marina]
MSDNPYEAPQTSGRSVEAVGVRSGSREDLKKVATYQKGILVCILLYFGIVIGQFLVPPELGIVLLLMLLGIALASMVFIFLLAMKVYSTALGIVLGIGALLPLIGLFILLMVNGKATRILKENGIKVGLLGANLSQI